MHPSPIRRLLAVVGATAILFAACGDDDDDSVDTPTTEPANDAVEAPDGLVSEGELTVCSDTPYEPFEMKEEDGTDTGFDMELARRSAPGPTSTSQ